ncbi:MAG TPA: hypothetical protein VGS10_20165 [Terracidiphilus sp.]|nr:hypothetical protein [Terracidiphilus sp.]
MQVIVRQIYEGMLIVLFLHMGAMAVVDSGQYRSRLIMLTGNTSRGLLYLDGPAALRSFWIFWPLALLVSLFSDVFFPVPPNPHLPPLPQRLGEIALFLVLLFLLMFVTAKWRARRRSVVAPFVISRGKLMNDVKALKASQRRFFSEMIPLPVFVLPDSDFARNCSRVRRSIVIPRSFLEQMSANAIKWLAAIQCCLQSDEFSDPVFWPALALDVVVAVTVLALRLKTSAIWLALLSVLAIEAFVIALAMPRLLLRSQIKAIGLSENPAAFFSAQGSLDRFGGASLPQPILLEIGRRTGVTPEQIAALLAEQTVPPEDRYPTTGSYLDTGLP